MARQKKIKTLQIEEKEEVKMSESETLEVLQSEIDMARIELEKIKRETEEKKQTLKSMPAREVSEEEMIIVKKQLSTSSEKQALKQKIEIQKQFDSQMITGKFINRRSPGKPAKLTYLKYDSDPVKWYTLEDGKVYTIPRGFADQLNGGTPEDPCYYTPQFVEKPGEMDPNKPQSSIHEIITDNKKYAFVPANF